MKRIVIGTDGSPQAREAVEFGFELAEQEGAEVLVAHVLAPLNTVAREETNRDVSHPIVTAEDDPALQAAGAIGEQRSVPYTLRLLVGLPEDEILALAHEVDAWLVVVGCRGVGTVKGALLGSVSRGVLNRADLPVLVVKGARVESEATAEQPSGSSSA